MIGLTTHNGPLGSNGSIIPGMGEAVSRVCAQIAADRSTAFMREARAWATGSRPGSLRTLDMLLTERRAMWRLGKARGAHRCRVLIVAECLRIKRDRIAADAGLQMAAE